MTRKLTLAALIVSAALPLTVAAQGYGGGQGASPSRDTTPSGTTPATPATPATPGAAGSPATPATPATPASPGERMGTGTAATGDTGATMFRELDRDKDGQVTKDEAKRSADVQARFDALDANHDGKVSMAEWSSGQREKKSP